MKHADATTGSRAEHQIGYGVVIAGMLLPAIPLVALTFWFLFWAGLVAIVWAVTPVLAWNRLSYLVILLVFGGALLWLRAHIDLRLETPTDRQHITMLFYEVARRGFLAFALARAIGLTWQAFGASRSRALLVDAAVPAVLLAMPVIPIVHYAVLEVERCFDDVLGGAIFPAIRNDAY